MVDNLSACETAISVKNLGSILIRKYDDKNKKSDNDFTPQFGDVSSASTIRSRSKHLTKQGECKV